MSIEICIMELVYQNNRNDNIPATITIAKFLDLKHIDIRWNAFDGNKVDLEYKI